jgi:hypothetical protein
MQVAMKFDKRFFFDRQAVADIVGKTAAKALGRAGAYVQRRARSSMRRGGKKQREAGSRVPSSPGIPPKAWSTDKVATLKNIQFAFVPREMSVFVGPLALNMGGMGQHGAIPGVHEHGGSRRILEWRFNQLEYMRSWRGWKKYRSSAKFSNEWQRRDLRWNDASRKRRKHTLSQLGVETRTRTASYPARPFMGPALQKEAPKFPTLFARGA